MKTLHKCTTPALCCGSGVCSVDVDQTLVDFAADLNWLKQQGVAVTRFNRRNSRWPCPGSRRQGRWTQAPKRCRCCWWMVTARPGRYPSCAELAQWLALTPETLPVRRRQRVARAAVAVNHSAKRGWLVAVAMIGTD